MPLAQFCSSGSHAAGFAPQSIGVSGLPVMERTMLQFSLVPQSASVRQNFAQVPEGPFCEAQLKPFAHWSLVGVQATPWPRVPLPATQLPPVTLSIPASPPSALLGVCGAAAAHDQDGRGAGESESIAH